MKKRGAVLIAALLTTMMWGSIDFDNQEILSDEYQIRQVDLSGPSKISDISELITFFGVERDRSMSAETPIGIYTLAGFIPSQTIQSEHLNYSRHARQTFNIVLGPASNHSRNRCIFNRSAG